MKKIYVLLLVTVGITVSATAQPFVKGDKLLGGSINVSNNDSPGPNNTSTYISINPSLGFFSKPNRLVGFSLNFGTDLNYQHSYGASIYKQYWNHLGKNVYFIMQGQIGFDYRTLRSINTQNFPDFGENYNRSYILSANVSPGFAYRINRRLLADAFLTNFLYVADAYTTFKTVYRSGSEVKSYSNDINVRTGLNGFGFDNIQFGFRYIL